MNIIVLCGGYSTERDVSIKSGTLVWEALCERGHKAVLVDSFFGYQGEYNDPHEIFDMPQEKKAAAISVDAPDLEKIKELRAKTQNDDSRIGRNLIEICRAADIVFMALHGEDGENGKLQALFDIEGIKYTGSGYLGSAIAMNKHLSKALFRNAGVSTPESITLYKNEHHYESIGFPCVVKPCSGGSSVGVSIVDNEADYKKALDLCFEYDTTVVVEKFIKGRELTIGVLDGKAMPTIEIVPKAGFYDYKNKYQAGLTDEYCPAPIGEENTRKLEAETLKAYEALNIDTYCRFDFIMDESGRFYCLEANTLPGMTPTSLIPQMAAHMGMSYGELCDKLIEISLKKYN